MWRDRLALRVWSVTRALARHQFLQLPHALSARDLEPLEFGLRGGDPRELAHGGPVQPAGSKRASQQRQLFERFCDAQLFLCRTRLVAERALDIFCKTAEAQVHVYGRAQCSEQPAPFFNICCSARLGQARQRLVGHHPSALLPGLDSRCCFPHTYSITCRFSRSSAARRSPFKAQIESERETVYEGRSTRKYEHRRHALWSLASVAAPRAEKRVKKNRRSKPVA